MHRPVCSALTLAVFVASLSACSTRKPPTFSGVRTERIESIAALTAPTGIDDDLHRSDPSGAVLNGPHYTLRIEWISTGTTLSATDARELRTTPVRAPEGSELVVAAVDPNATYAAFQGGHVEVSVTVAGQATPVTGLPIAMQPRGQLPAATTLILISAPRGAALRLRATDAGRSEELDLRTGKVLVNSYDLRQSGALQWSGSTTVQDHNGEGASAPASMSVGNATAATGASEVATLTSYTPDLDWAPKDSAILLVPAPALTIDPLAYYGREHEQFSDQNVFTFRTSDGKTIPATPHPRDLQLIPAAGDDNDAPVTFIVPAGITSGTIAMDLVKAQLTYELGESSIQQPSQNRKNISWTRAPAPFTLALSFPS
jgi:hypothetical protein